MNFKNMLKNELTPPSINMLGAGSEVNGDITIDGDLRIDGKISGNILCSGKLLISSFGYVEGTIKCKNAEISGDVIGSINATDLITLKETSKLNGDIVAGKLIVEAGAILTMKCSTVQIQPDQQGTPFTE